MSLRPPTCHALDPLKSVTHNGHTVNRHCRREIDHDPPHITLDMWGEVVHAWWWEDDGDGIAESATTAAATGTVAVVPLPPEQLTL